MLTPKSVDKKQKRSYNTDMTQIIKQSTQHTLPITGLLAYWSTICAPMFSNDRGSEKSRVREMVV